MSETFHGSPDRQGDAAMWGAVWRLSGEAQSQPSVGEQDERHTAPSA